MKSFNLRQLKLRSGEEYRDEGDVLPAEAKERLVGRFLQPDVEGHRPPPEVVVDALGGLELGFLHDVGGVQPAAHPRVQAELDGPAEEAAVQGEQAVQGLPVAGHHLRQQAPGLVGVGSVEVHANASPRGMKWDCGPTRFRLPKG